MALQATAGHLVLGIGLMIASCHRGAAYSSHVQRWAPILAGIGVAAVSLLLWQALLAREHQQFRRMIDHQTALLHRDIKSQMAMRTFPLERMATLWALRGQPDPGIWRDEAQYDMQHISGYDAIAWIDPQMRVQWSEPDTAEEALHRSDLSQYEPQREGFAFARSYRDITFTHPLSVPRWQLRVSSCDPHFSEPTFAGWIVGWFHVDDLLDVMLQNKLRNFSIAIVIGGDEIYGRYDESRRHEANWSQESSLSLHGVVWQRRLWPTAQPLVETFSPLPDLVLASGMVTAILLM